jgi:two-component system, sensor histidine kinase and response regulator
VRAKGLELSAILEPGVPARAVGDPGRLRQVLLNLVGNAVKFTQSGEVLIRAAIEPDPTDDVVVRIAVTDTGIGIPHDVQQVLFKPFAQADASTTRRFGGTGLGLAISRQLVELMSGAIGVESEHGRGSTFWFTVRLGRAVGILEHLPSLTALESVPVLVIDDQPISRKVLERQLSRAGLLVEAMSDGDDLQQAAEAGTPFAVVIIDRLLAQTDGFAVARRIKAEPRLSTTPLVLITSAPYPGLPADARAAGFDAHLTRPIKQEHLISRLQTTLALATVHTLALATVQVPATTVEPASPLQHSSVLILLAKDNPVNQRVASRMLSKLGHRVDVVSNGVEAVEASRRVPYNLILLDCHMPEMDGFEAAGVIRRSQTSDTRVPIVALTANAMADDRERCLGAGMDDYLAKPVKLEDLRRMVAKWCVEAHSAPDRNAA